MDDVGDDSLDALVTGAEPCAIGDIVPDMITDEQTEEIFKLLPPKDIIDGLTVDCSVSLYII